MGINKIVTLRPPPSGTGKRTYVDKHDLAVSKGSEAGNTKIEFAANDWSFVVVIPEADSLFTTPPENTLHFRVSAGTSVETPVISNSVTDGQKYEYHVFCEEDQDWAHKRGSSPPKIIIDP